MQVEKNAPILPEISQVFRVFPQARSLICGYIFWSCGRFGGSKTVSRRKTPFFGGDDRAEIGSEDGLAIDFRASLIYEKISSDGDSQWGVPPLGLGLRGRSAPLRRSRKGARWSFRVGFAKMASTAAHV